MFNFNDSLVSIRNNKLWKQFEGDYLDYFRESTFNPSKFYSIEFIANENPYNDKIFNNIEFKADVLNNSITGVSQDSAMANFASANTLPFLRTRTWNEYQDTGYKPFVPMVRRGTNLSQKFRIWRSLIDRDALSTNRFDRIRGPWARFYLEGGFFNKTVIHDIAVDYV
jgi:hypothetical protein